jgi:hypothetical protein
MRHIRKLLFGLSLLGFPAFGFAQGTVVYTNNPVIVHGMKNQGTYSSGTTYALNDVVTYSGGSYLSLVANNVGHTPSSSPTQWQAIGSSLAVPNSGILKANGSGGLVAATADTDYPSVSSVTAASNAASAAQSTANAAIPATQKGAANGVATLDSTGKVPTAQIPHNLVSTGLLADYKFLDGSGTTVTDSSGNGNNATLTASHLPTWVQSGLQFSASTQGLTLPAAINGAQTVELLACPDSLPATAGITKANQYPLFIASSLGMTGLNILYTGGLPGLYAIGIAAGGSNQDLTIQNFSGCHVFTFALGTGGGVLDHLYIDGREVSYTQQGSSAGKQTSGNLYFGYSGVSPYNSSGFIGTLYRMRVLSGQVTSGQAAADATILISQEKALGIDPTPTQYVQSTPQLHIIGDSLSCSWNGTACNTSYSWVSQLILTNQPTYTITNWGVYGAYMQAMAASEPYRVSPYCRTNNGPAIAINFGATNDLSTRSAAQVGQTAASLAQSMKAAGCDPYIATILSRTGSTTAPGTPTADAQKNSYNALVAAQWKSWGYKGVIDFGATLMGADGAYANTTYFLVDGTHNTSTGEALKATVASNTLNYYYSQYSEANPHVVTASSTLANADAAVSIGTLSGAVALVMPDCTGPTGATYVIANPQAAQAVTIAGGASQPINGLSSAITIPANSTVRLTDVANPRPTAGCHWVM